LESETREAAVKTCPYCETDLTELWRRLADETDPGLKVASLCAECGEPLFLTADRRKLRAPTSDEHLEIAHSNEWVAARTLWLEAQAMGQSGALDEMRKNWNEVAAIFKRRALRAGQELGPTSERMLHLAYLCGAVSMVKAAQDDIDASEGPNQAHTRLEIRHAELNDTLAKLGYAPEGSFHFRYTVRETMQ
jgi:hypothetical protein